MSSILQCLGWVVLCFSLMSCMTTTSSKKKPDPVKLATRKSNVLINLGMAYAERGQYEVAMEEYNKALKINPASFDAHTAIANLYENIDQPALAQQHYKKAIELAPNNPSTLNNYGKYLCNNDNYIEAESYFSKAAETPLYSRPWLPLTNAGQCFQRAGNLTKAEHNYRSALKKNPAYAPALIAMSELSYQQSKFQSARAFLQRFEANNQLSAEQLSLAVSIEESLGDMKTAQKYSTQLEKKYPDFHNRRKTTKAIPVPRIDKDDVDSRNSQLPLKQGL